MLRGATFGLLTLSLAVAPAVAPAAAATPTSVTVAAGLPKGSVRHQAGPYWVWFGSPKWIASYGTYGISIQSANGKLALDYGFSSILCASAPTVQRSVTKYFANRRATFRQTAPVAKLKLSAGRIRQLPVRSYGPLYFRQVVTWKGKIHGEKYRGELVFDYSLASGPTYCFSRNQSRTAPKQGYTASIKQLRSVQGALAYSGPGVDTGDQTDPDS